MRHPGLSASVNATIKASIRQLQELGLRELVEQCPAEMADETPSKGRPSYDYGFLLTAGLVGAARGLSLRQLESWARTELPEEKLPDHATWARRLNFNNYQQISEQLKDNHPDKTVLARLDGRGLTIESIR